MMRPPSFSLHLVATPNAERPTVAWLLRGDDPAEWLRVLCDAGLSLLDARFYPVPQGPHDSRIAGVLVTGLAPEGVALPPLPRALPYGRHGDRLYLPVDSRLQPNVAPKEILDHYDCQLVLIHPHLGTIAYQPHHALTLDRLVTPPPRRRSHWTEAQPGLILQHQLKSVTLLHPPSADDILLDGRDDIGTAPPELLPPTDHEPAPGLGEKLKDGINRTVAKSLQGIVNKLRRQDGSGGGTSGTTQGGGGIGGGDGELFAGLVATFGAGAEWLKSLGSWTDRTLQRLGTHDPGKSSAINRLLEMLEKDPDAGLRHALPVGGDAGRGTAPSGNVLGTHQVDFSLGRLGGAGSSDPWSVPQETYQHLLRRYRELARRELELKRYRRAAYIYAHLLQDYAAAANVLQQGHHYREAAVLYLDFLKQPLRAAKCLEEGGLLLEAIRLYQDEGADETVGDLYHRLDRQDAAVIAWRRAAEHLRESDDRLAAARLLEQKIGAPDEALEVLASAWPFTSQAGACLQAQFDLLGRLSRHDAASELLQRLAADPSPRMPMTLAESLAHVVDAYPVIAIRHDAADLCRVVVGNRLNLAGYEESRMLLNAIQRTLPSDQLLARDTARFRSAKRRDRINVQRAVPPASQTANPTLIGSFNLPPMMLLGAAARRDGFFATGMTPAGGLALVRKNWKGSDQQLGWPCATTDRDRLPDHGSLILDAGFYESQPVILFDRKYGPLPEQRYPVTDTFTQKVSAGTPSWLHPTIVGLAQGHHQLIWVLRLGEHSDQLRLTAHLSDGKLINEREIDLGFVYTPQEHGPISMLAVRNSVHIVVDRSLIEVSEDHLAVFREQRARILSLASSAPYTRQRLVAAFDRGGVVIWPNRQGEHYEHVATDLEQPLFTFTRGGTLIAISGERGEIYETGYQNVTRTTTFTLRSEDAFAVTPAAGATDFAVFHRNGTVSQYQVDSE